MRLHFIKLRKKKAFTLTELLVVVVIIGVLSAVALPKFNRVVETRRTSEAEEMMAAIRTEQEKRCTLDQSYAENFKQVGDVVASAAEGSTASTDNYQYSLQATGVSAQRNGKDYQLSIPSYADGRLCCTGSYCSNLNKNYPPCTQLLARADYQTIPACAGKPEVKSCSGASAQSCGCLGAGSQTRTCDTTSGEWSSWSACTTTDACDCTFISGDQPVVRQNCNTCGTQTRSVSCNTSTGSWSRGEWSSCSKTAAECGSNSEEGSVCNGNITISSWEFCCSNKPVSNSRCYKTCSRSESSGMIVPVSNSYAWSGSDQSCNSGPGPIIADSISCEGISCTAKTRGTRCCHLGSILTCIENPGHGTGGPITTTTTYYCANYAGCAEGCAGYKKGSTSSNTENDNSYNPPDHSYIEDKDPVPPSVPVNPNKPKPPINIGGGFGGGSSGGGGGGYTGF